VNKSPFWWVVKHKVGGYYDPGGNCTIRQACARRFLKRRDARTVCANFDGAFVVLVWARVRVDWNDNASASYSCARFGGYHIAVDQLDGAWRVYVDHVAAGQAPNRDDAKKAAVRIVRRRLVKALIGGTP
jgi:hypothetical protein